MEQLNINEIPVISEKKQYWLIRTFGGITFNDYHENNYVGIGVNNVPQELIKSADYDRPNTIDALVSFVHNNTKYKKGAATKFAKELISFQHEMQIGDTVIIPNESSNLLAIGEIIGNVKIVKSDRKFHFKNKLESFPEKRRQVKWIKTIYKDDLNGDLKSVTSTYHGLTNVNQYADLIEGTIDSLYIKNNRGYFTLKINQDEEINAYVLSRFLDGLTYFYEEFCKNNGIESNENLYIKIKLQSKGRLALQAASAIGLIGIATMIALSNNSEVNLDLKNLNLKFKSDGYYQSRTKYEDAKQEREMRKILFLDSMEQLKAKRYDDSLRLVEKRRNNSKAEGEESD